MAPGIGCVWAVCLAGSCVQATMAADTADLRLPERATMKANGAEPVLNGSGSHAFSLRSVPAA